MTDPPAEQPHDGVKQTRFIFQNDSVWIPFYPWWRGCDARKSNLVWNVLLPIYTLLELFDLTNHSSLKLLLLPSDDEKDCIQSLNEYASWPGWA
jgi:hypothetical protein